MSTAAQRRVVEGGDDLGAGGAVTVRAGHRGDPGELGGGGHPGGRLEDTVLDMPVSTVVPAATPSQRGVLLRMTTAGTPK